MISDMFDNLGPVDAIPENIAKEWMSLCYVRGVVAQAGLNTGNCVWDDGVDLTVRSDKSILGSMVEASQICLQLKATKNWTIVGDKLSYSVKAKTYSRLISENRQDPLFLVLYPLPQERREWITYLKSDPSDAHYASIFNHTGYFADLRGKDAIPASQGSKSIHIPLKNHFNSDSLLQLYKSHLKEMETAIKAVKSFRRCDKVTA